tara:strand:+ start:4491 stop:5183 length:693 start_codon:yes stop_codon:yes gene_type:complete
MYFEESNLGFLHVPKAAGTSIRDALEVHSSRSFPPERCHAGVSDFINMTKEMPFFNDKTEYFAVVRNTYERLVSLYLYGMKKEKEREAASGRGTLNFGSFLHAIARGKFQNTASQLWWITDVPVSGMGGCTCKSCDDPECQGSLAMPDNRFRWAKFGEITVDHIFRFEDLTKCEEFLRERISEDIKLPYLNTTERKGIHYSCYYSEELKELVSGMYSQEIATFGFEFEEA